MFTNTKKLIFCVFISSLILLPVDISFSQNKDVSLELSFGGNYFPPSNYLKDFGLIKTNHIFYSHVRNNELNYSYTISLNTPLYKNFSFIMGLGYYNTKMLMNSYNLYKPWDALYAGTPIAFRELLGVQYYEIEVKPITFGFEYYFKEPFSGFSPFLGIGISHFNVGGKSELLDYDGRDIVFDFSGNSLGYNLSVGFIQNLSNNFYLKFKTSYVSTKRLNSVLTPVWFFGDDEISIMRLNTFNVSVGLGWYIGKLF
ncbi:hypothetical protein ACFL7D_04505 [candidate division KSB1 bacterium]